MKLREWKDERNMSYEDLGNLVGLSTNKMFRLCEKSKNISLSDAMKIVEKIPEIKLEDFLK